MSLSLSEHHGPWTVDDVRKLPEDEFHRYEIDDGVLIVSPRPSSPHQAASYRITRLLDDAIDAAGLDLAAIQEVDTVTGHRGDWLKVPDVLVVTGDAFDAGPQEYDAADVVLAVEISGSRQSRNRDFGEKLQAYADVGIEDYWVVELSPVPRVTTFGLKGGRYEELAVFDRLHHLTRPFPVDIDPPQLLLRRTRT
jgi:Uma2 family endonuclease